MEQEAASKTSNAFGRNGLRIRDTETTASIPFDICDLLILSVEFEKDRRAPGRAVPLPG